jgi:hypothetical protein
MTDDKAMTDDRVAQLIKSDSGYILCVPWRMSEQEYERVKGAWPRSNGMLFIIPNTSGSKNAEIVYIDLAKERPFDALP